MVFSSLIFLVIFLPISLAGYYLLDRRFKNTFLLIMSLAFYAWGEINFLPIMLISIIINYVFGLLVDKFREKKPIAYLSIGLMAAWNVVIFFIYKYLNFTIINLNAIFNLNIEETHFVLPIGISFFTFQAMSYVIDVYRGKGSVQKNPFNVALYIMFFPQLIAGPIVRYETVAAEIKNRKETLDDFAKGVKRFIVGLGKKVIISNTVALIADYCFNLENYSELSVALAWIGALCYTIQIFFDFSGYSDMAIGLGLMFGFHFNENFNYPYCSASVSEFWRRWHISLGSWFRDYVYFPLGGSRVKSTARLVFNLFVVWLLTGIWHGANWNFVVWGLFYFVILTFEKLTGIPEKKLKSKPLKALYRVFTLFAVVMGWVIFRAPDMGAGLQYIGSMFGMNGNNFINYTSSYLAKEILVTVIIAIVFSMPVVPKLRELSAKVKGGTVIYSIVEYAALIAILIFSIAFSTITSYDPFIYFNF